MRRAGSLVGLAALAGAVAHCATQAPAARPAPQLVATAPRCEGEPATPVATPTRGFGFPVVAPIANADPMIRAARVVRMPTRIRLRPVDGGFMASWDPDSLEAVTVDVGCHMVVAYESSFSVGAPGVDVPTAFRNVTAADFTAAQGHGESRLERPAGDAARSSVVRARAVVFETDVPPQHEWSPQSGRYRVLHERTVETPLPPLDPHGAPTLARAS